MPSPQALLAAPELSAVIASRFVAMIVPNKLHRLTSMVTLRWSQYRQIEWHYVGPSEP